MDGIDRYELDNAISTLQGHLEGKIGDLDYRIDEKAREFDREISQLRKETHHDLSREIEDLHTDLTEIDHAHIAEINKLALEQRQIKEALGNLIPDFAYELERIKKADAEMLAEQRRRALEDEDQDEDEDEDQDEGGA